MPMHLWAEQSPPLGNGKEGRLSAHSQEGPRPNKAQANPRWGGGHHPWFPDKETEAQGIAQFWREPSSGKGSSWSKAAQPKLKPRLYCFPPQGPPRVRLGHGAFAKELMAEWDRTQGGGPSYHRGGAQDLKADGGGDGVRTEALPPPTGEGLGSHLTSLSLHIICKSGGNLSILSL